MKIKSKNKKGSNMHFNTHFNRFESAIDHHYAPFNYLDFKYTNAIARPARLKCKLVHMEGASIIIPELILLDDYGWIQPLHFQPNQLHQLEEEFAVCVIQLDIQNGETIRIRFSNTDFIDQLPDKSQIYRCEILGPEDLQKYSCGDYIEENGKLLLHLFHHTDDQGFDGITASKSIRSSVWNYKGNKQCVNYHFVYCTHIPEIIFDSDLITVAMSAEGKIHYMVDGFQQPKYIFPKDLETKYKDFIYVAKVYRESSSKRQNTIEFYIPIEDIDTKHLYKHYQDGFTFYEICFPYIHRIRTRTDVALMFDEQYTILNQPCIVHSDYAIMGNAQTKEGLAAPFEEEETTCIYKIEDCKGIPIPLYWFKHGNEDLFSRKSIIPLQVQAVKSNPTIKK